MIYLFEEVQIKSSDTEEPIEDLLEKAKKAYKYLLDGNRFWNKKGIPIRFTDRGFNEFFYSVENVIHDDLNNKAATGLINRNRHCLRDLLNTVERLQDIVENMDFQFYSKNKKPDQKPFLRGMEYYECPVMINGKRRKVKLAFEKHHKDKDKEAKYYYHYLAESIQKSEIVISHFFIN
jgi:hypothetical protein